MNTNGQDLFPILGQPKQSGLEQLLNRPVDRRTAIQTAAAALTAPRLFKCCTLAFEFCE